MKFNNFKDVEKYLGYELDYEYDLDEVVGGNDYYVYEDGEFEDMIMVVNDCYYWVVIRDDEVRFVLEDDEIERKIIEDILGL